MKRVKHLLFLFIMMIPVVVSASINELPETVETNEGLTFYNNGSEYSAYVSDSTNEINLKLDNFTGYTIQGSNKFYINDNVTVYNLLFTDRDDQSGISTKVVPFRVVKQNSETQSIVLNNLEVVGYKLDYKSTLNEYTVTVPSNIDSVYINAEVAGNVSYAEGAGIVKLDGKKTVATIVVSNPGLGESTYTVTIVKKNYILTTIIIAIVILALVVGILLFLFKKYQDKVSTVSTNILNKDVKDLDIDSIVKASEEKKTKKEDNVSNESLTPGVLTPRTMIPEDKTK